MTEIEDLKKNLENIHSKYNKGLIDEGLYLRLLQSSKNRLKELESKV